MVASLHYPPPFHLASHGYILETFHEKPTDFTGERVIHWIQREKPEAVIIDETGLGAGVVDHVRNRGFNQSNGFLVVGFNGGADPIDGKMYHNRRAEVWGSAKEWLEAGASIPDDPELAADLTGVTFDYSRLKVRHGSIILESKDDMKRRGFRSPDKGDTLAMSFAVTIAPRPQKRQEERPWVGRVPPEMVHGWEDKNNYTVAGVSLIVTGHRRRSNGSS